jgi:glycerol-3-phosphate dehydrogenase (NAD(P)+)
MSAQDGTSAELRIAVIGAGSWGTALVKLLSGNEEKVGWWVRRKETIDHITKYGHNPDYTSGAQFDVQRLAMDTDIRAVVKNADVVVIAVPSAFLKTAMDQLEPDALKGKTCFSAVKGIVPETNQIVGEFLFEHWGVQKNDLGIICGPCHAEEVALERLSYLTIASRDPEKAKHMGDALSGRFLKTTLERRHLRNGIRRDPEERDRRVLRHQRGPGLRRQLPRRAGEPRHPRDRALRNGRASHRS